MACNAVALLTMMNTNPQHNKTFYMTGNDTMTTTNNNNNDDNINEPASYKSTIVI